MVETKRFTYALSLEDNEDYKIPSNIKTIFNSPEEAQMAAEKYVSDNSLFDHEIVLVEVTNLVPFMLQFGKTLEEKVV